MAHRSARTPFRFLGCIELREILGQRARDEQELMELLEQVPVGSVYYHTHSVFLHTLESRVWRGQPHGDFAGWVERDLGLPSLAAAIARINPYLGGLEQVRARMLDLLDAALRGEAPAGGL